MSPPQGGRASYRESARQQAARRRSYGPLRSSMTRIAADAHPAHPTANADLAAFHLLRGELDAGERRARAAVALDPDQASAWYSLALVAQARGSRAAAREAYERFLATAGAEYEPEKRAVRAMLQQADRP